MILLVEDEPLIRMVTAETLADAGFAVEEAANAAEALTRMTTSGHGVEAVIIDIGLPDRPGDALAQELRQMSPDLPILMASGYDGGKIAGLFKGDSYVGFIGKPYTGTALVQALAALGVRSPSDGV